MINFPPISKKLEFCKYEKDKAKPRTFLINTKNPISRDLILGSAYELKEYNQVVYINPELNSTDTKEQNEHLKTRRQLIDDKNNNLDTKDTRIRNLLRRNL